MEERTRADQDQKELAQGADVNHKPAVMLMVCNAAWPVQFKQWTLPTCDTWKSGMRE